MRTMTERRRPHPAAASRVAALGLGTATMLGLVGAMTLAQRASADQPALVPATAPQIVVVVHPADAATGAAGAPATQPVPAPSPGSPGQDPDTSVPTPAPAAVPAPAPVVLTAQPVIVPAAPAAAPAASTHGSR